MLASELALQLFRDVRASASMLFRPGHNAVVCDNIAPETVADALLELLFPGSAPRETGRGALTFTARDGQSFRVLRDFSSDMGQLQTLNAVSKQFAPVSEGLANVSKAMRHYVGPAPRDAVVATFVLQPNDLPGVASAEADSPAARERLRVLETKLASYQRINQLDGEIHELNRRKSAAEDIAKRLTGDASSVRQAEAEFAHFAHLSVLADSFVSDYSEMTSKEAQRNADLKQIDNERTELERLLRAADASPLFKDARVISGLLVGVATIATGLTLGGSYRLLAFLDVPAFGLVTWALWQNLGHRDEVGGAKKRIAQLEQRKAQISVRDSDAIARVRSQASLVGLSSLTEVREVIAARAAAKKTLADVQEAFVQQQANPELTRAHKEVSELKRTIAHYEQERSDAGVTGGDAGAIMAEVTTLRRLLGVAAPSAGDELKRALVPMRFLGAKSAEVALAVSERASQIVATLSGGRLTRVDVDIDGTIYAMTGSTRGPASGLSPLARSLVVLALRAAIILALPHTARLPVVVHPVTVPIENGEAVLRAFASVLAQGGVQVVQLVRTQAHAQGVPNVVRAA
ncbi:MAG: hypothetical protein H7Z43_11760 [Clostridia bacterium]|nr:hypothetical protein [Deltaproteobacteria bacterium]